MPVKYLNRKRDAYYLNAGLTKTGKPRYWFAKSNEGDLVESIPEGYEIYENPDSQVFLRKIVPQLVTPAEVAVVREGVKRYAPGENCIIDVQKEHIVVYHSERLSLDLDRFGFGFRELPTYHGTYTKIMRFTLIDDKDRRFRVQRWCFRGSIDRWIDLRESANKGNLSDLVKRFCPHIGRDSFFELM